MCCDVNKPPPAFRSLTIYGFDSKSYLIKEAKKYTTPRVSIEWDKWALDNKRQEIYLSKTSFSYLDSAQYTRPLL